MINYTSFLFQAKELIEELKKNQAAVDRGHTAPNATIVVAQALAEAVNTALSELEDVS